MAFNAARHEAFDDAGIEYKSWLSAHGPNPRSTHLDVEDATADAPVSINDPFDVVSPDGDLEQMMFPGDDSLGASAGNIINCQCIQLAARKTGEDATSTTYKIFGAGELNFPKTKS